MDAQETCAKGFEAVLHAFEAMFDDLQERGAGVVTTTSGRHTMIDPRPQQLAALAYAVL